MRKFLSFAILLMVFCSAKAQLNVVSTAANEGYETIYQSFIGVYYVRYYANENAFYLLGRTDFAEEQQMLSIKLGETKESAIQTLNDLKNLDSKENDIYVEGMNGMKIRIAYFNSPLVKTYSFESEGVKGRCWMNNIDFKKAIRKLENWQPK